MADTADGTPPKAKFDWDRVVGLSALLASIATVAFLAYQAYLMRVQVEASTWPYLQVWESCCGDGIGFSMENKGVGPAAIKLAVVKVDGKPVKNWKQVLDALVKEQPASISTASLTRRVVKSGELVRLIEIPDPAYAQRLQAEILKGRLTAAICYCSVLGKCWLAVPTQESQEVEACPDVPAARRFDQ